MRLLRERLTYSNVMATVAVFIALGGGAYALSRGEVESRHIAPDAVKARHIDFGVRSQAMLANFNGLDSGSSGSPNRAPVGLSNPGDLPEMLAPQEFVATGLRIRLDGPLATGSREFVLAFFEGGSNEVTDLGCSVQAGEDTCSSKERARVPAGSSVWFEARYTNTSQVDYAEVGWRAVLP